MTDRQIMAAFFPDSIPKPKGTGKKLSQKEIFWKVGQGRGYSEAAIQAAWDRERTKESPLASHVRGGRLAKKPSVLTPSEGLKKRLDDATRKRS